MLRAYGEHDAVCSLGHRQLLGAARILGIRPDPQRLEQAYQLSRTAAPA